MHRIHVNAARRTIPIKIALLLLRNDEQDSAGKEISTKPNEENMRVKLFKEAGILSCHEWMAVKKHIDSVRI